MNKNEITVAEIIKILSETNQDYEIMVGQTLSFSVNENRFIQINYIACPAIIDER